MAPAAVSLFAPQYRAYTIGVVAFTTLFAFEAIGVATALPTVAADLNGLDVYAWAFNGFLIAGLIGMVLSGEWCDARGPRQPMIAALTVFAVGCIMCAIAPTMSVLLVGRVVSGLGFGIAIVGIFVVIGRGYPDDLRPRAFPLIATAWVVPSIVGPFIAGFLATTIGWRWVFAIVVPVLIPGALLLVPRLAELGGGTDHELDDDVDADRTRSRKRLVLAAVVALSLVGIQEAGTRRGPVGVASVVVALPVLVLALRRLLPAGTLRVARGIPTAVLLRGLIAGGYFGAEAFVPLALQTQRGLSPTIAGLALTAGAIGWFCGSFTQGRLHAAWGPQRLLRTGSAVTATGLAVLPLGLVLPLPGVVTGAAWALASFGMGMSFATLGNHVLTASALDEQGENSAALQVADSTGSILLIGLCGAIYGAALAANAVGTVTFTAMWWLMALTVGLATALALRIAPKTHAGRAMIRPGPTGGTS